MFFIISFKIFSKFISFNKFIIFERLYFICCLFYWLIKVGLIIWTKTEIILREKLKFNVSKKFVCALRQARSLDLNDFWTQATKTDSVISIFLTYVWCLESWCKSWLNLIATNRKTFLPWMEAKSTWNANNSAHKQFSQILFGHGFLIKESFAIY
jgi:phosphoribosylformylglycinamidine (FGAM) synthase-like amidotransferase family enzyme